MTASATTFSPSPTSPVITPSLTLSGILGAVEVSYRGSPGFRPADAVPVQEGMGRSRRPWYGPCLGRWEAAEMPLPAVNEDVRTQAGGARCQGFTRDAGRARAGTRGTGPPWPQPADHT